MAARDTEGIALSYESGKLATTIVSGREPERLFGECHLLSKQRSELETQYKDRPLLPSTGSLRLLKSNEALLRNLLEQANLREHTRAVLFRNGLSYIDPKTWGTVSPASLVANHVYERRPRRKT